MNKIILVGMIAVLAACSNNNGAESVPPATQDQEVQTAPQPVEARTDQAQTVMDDLARLDDPNKFRETTVDPEKLRLFATELYQKIDDDQKYLEDAFELGEMRTIGEYMSKILPKYRDEPFDLNHGTPSDPYWPNAKEAEIYNWCRDAFGNLDVYSQLLFSAVSSDTAFNRRSIRNSKSNLEKSKANCKTRVDMTPEQAIAADEAEYNAL